jgi:hypothetical protein
MADLRNISLPHRDANTTCGSWDDEADAEDYFADFVGTTGRFTVYRQVCGRATSEPHFRNHDKSSTSLRADFLLVPKRTLIDQGWDGGIILIEAKRSGLPIGKGLSQLLDYMSAVWTIHGGISIVPTFGFLFPALRQRMALASVMAHRHIGTAVIQHDTLELLCGEKRVISIGRAGDVNLGSTDFGRKTGSR